MHERPHAQCRRHGDVIRTIVDVDNLVRRLRAATLNDNTCSSNSCTTRSNDRLNHVLKMRS